MSLPPWERGLKHLCARIRARARMSLRWHSSNSSTGWARIRARARMSLPPWERGLKLSFLSVYGGKVIVAPPVGAWIETPWSKQYICAHRVAPPVGAWIETNTLR